jgi:hypothetical protein
MRNLWLSRVRGDMSATPAQNAQPFYYCHSAEGQEQANGELISDAEMLTDNSLRPANLNKTICLP